MNNLLNFKVGPLNFSPSYLQAGAIVALIFILVLTLAQFRRHYVNWSFKGAAFGIFFGFILALVLEGFLIVGGKTALTSVLGWQNPPKPVEMAIEAGREKLIQVLGISNEIKTPALKTGISAKDVVKFFQTLTPNEVENVRKVICE